MGIDDPRREGTPSKSSTVPPRQGALSVRPGPAADLRSALRAQLHVVPSTVYRDLKLHWLGTRIQRFGSLERHSAVKAALLTELKKRTPEKARSTPSRSHIEAEAPESSSPSIVAARSEVASSDRLAGHGFFGHALWLRAALGPHCFGDPQTQDE